MNIKKWFSKFRIFKRLKEANITIMDYAYNIDQFRAENNQLKDQLMNRRKRISELETTLLEAVNDLNLLGEKKKRGEILIAEIVKRRDEFINRVSAIPDASITNFNDYKYWISEPFIVDSYKTYVVDKDAIDGMSAIKGFGKILKKIDEKKQSSE